MPLKPMVVEEPFQQWGLNFSGVINPNYSTSHNFILIATDYFTRWFETIPFNNVD